MVVDWVAGKPLNVFRRIPVCWARLDGRWAGVLTISPEQQRECPTLQ